MTSSTSDLTRRSYQEHVGLFYPDYPGHGTIGPVFRDVRVFARHIKRFNNLSTSWLILACLKGKAKS